MTDLVATERRGRVLVVSMQRAHKRNAVDRALADAIDAALSTLDDDNALWAGVLTGTADVFSAGSDLTSNGDYVTERGGFAGGGLRDLQARAMAGARSCMPVSSSATRRSTASCVTCRALSSKRSP